MSGDTRARILSVANELFIEQGYEGTSLREIADRLDITKAALYYHFRSKDEILETLLSPFDTLLDELLGRLEAAHDVDAWADAKTRRRWLNDPAVKVRTATSPKSMRLGFPDGSIVAVGFMPKGDAKSAVAIQHTKLPDRETVNRLKEYLAEKFDELTVLLRR